MTFNHHHAKIGAARGIKAGAEQGLVIACQHEQAIPGHRAIKFDQSSDLDDPADPRCPAGS